MAIADVNEDGVDAIHDKYVAWCKTMFASMVLFYILLCAVPICFNNGCESWGKYTAFCFTSYCGIVYMVGMCFRFGEAGKFASSDALEMNESSVLLRQEHSGKFLFIFDITFTTILVLFNAFFLIAIIMKDRR